MKQLRSSANGFTLVELAIVMIIIGLLIGGVMKGQELVQNSKATGTIAQIKDIEAANLLFRDMYNTWPGIMTNAGVRIPGCVDLCEDYAGLTQLNTTPGGRQGDSAIFFLHLAAANLLNGINQAVGPNVWGGYQPAAKIGGGFGVGHTDPAVAQNFVELIPGDNTPAAGLYLVLTALPAEIPYSFMRPIIAYKIDTKLDDGQPDSGSILSNESGNSPAGGSCGSNTGYIENESIGACFLYIRIGK